jgi:GH3 auxin-responsive promoter
MIFHDALGLLSTVTLFPFYRRKYRAFLAAHDHAAGASEAALLRHVAQCRDTGFGRDHRFETITSLEAFRAQVPVADYEDLRPYLEAVAAGDHQALIPDSEDILTFSCTTGTTGTPKILPITKNWLATYQRHSKIWGVKAIMDHPEMMTKRWLQITGPLNVSKTPSGHSVGMMSAITIKYQNPIFRLFYAAPASLGDIAESDVRNYAILRLAVPEPIGFLATITASNLIQLAEFSDAVKQDLIRDIHDGTTTGPMTGHKWPTQDLERRGRKRHPERAKELERIVARTGTLYPKDYWDLELIACWTGGTVGYQSKNLATYFGPAAVRDIGYVSTEGRHTVPVDDHSADGVLVSDGAFYEFEPLGSGQPLLAHQLERGQSYSVILTNGQGLWRYRLGDVVRCTGYQGQSPILAFLHKTGQVSDMEGEKISAEHLVSAVTAALETLSMPTLNFSCVPVRPAAGAPYYKFLFEDSGPRTQNSETALLTEIDQNLRTANIMYRQKRASHALAMPRAAVIAPGTWAKLGQDAGARNGTGATQYKLPVLMEADALSALNLPERKLG